MISNSYYYIRGVAQPGSAPALGAGGRVFESLRPDHSVWNYYETKDGKFYKGKSV